MTFQHIGQRSKGRTLAIVRTGVLGARCLHVTFPAMTSCRCQLLFLFLKSDWENAGDWECNTSVESDLAVSSATTEMDL